MFKVVVRLCRKKTREVKAQLELNLAASVKKNKTKQNKKRFYKKISRKSWEKENLYSLLDAVENTTIDKGVTKSAPTQRTKVTKDKEKAKLFYTLFV